jgi:hypothetical protein
MHQNKKGSQSGSLFYWLLTQKPSRAEQRLLIIVTEIVPLANNASGTSPPSRFSSQLSPIFRSALIGFAQ